MEGKCQTENDRRPSPAASLVHSQRINSDGPDPLLVPMPTCPTGSDDVHTSVGAPPAASPLAYRGLACLGELNPWCRAGHACRSRDRHVSVSSSHGIIRVHDGGQNPAPQPKSKNVGVQWPPHSSLSLVAVGVS